MTTTDMPSGNWPKRRPKGSTASPGIYAIPPHARFQPPVPEVPAGGDTPPRGVDCWPAETLRSGEDLSSQKAKFLLTPGP